MLRATTLIRKAAVRADAVADRVTLDHAARQALPATLTGRDGLGFTPALAKAAALEDGDALRLEDGRLVLVEAATESLLEVRATNPARLLRLAWQLGGSHVPAEIAADVLYVPASAAELVRGQGCTATPVTRAFKPEREAHDHSQCGHDHGHAHAHDHGHAHDHADHAHSHSHAHEHTHDHGHSHGHDHAPKDHGHVHGPDCKHDH
ncbi:Urease accessory protein UreE [Methylobacterium adhaesivum]|jgi:urease accessory protein|uniref:Urease accessory protein UreE n=1 Tax=Methylobacterium adhaesivum TaxID=333297 RepID=A0ABT8BM93_9HYPH|nr:urease accessory protein UreE [Methylobacterium adhaesivum]MDN3592455.1 urease accessory protein UreE [Methylobacterium adhaesivum]GJD32328.1 Urease accessory protein UreE [Methylobacterium adhaesivum]